MKLLTILAAFTIAFVTTSLHAQIGEDNPGGVAGRFNAMSYTGGYDPYTGNVKRSITDIVVPGAVGAYPLAFTRTLNSRPVTVSGIPGASQPEFGKAGTWRHSYQWNIDPATFTNDQTAVPTNYTVTYPDGRRLSFDSVHSYRGPAGIPDYFQPLPSDFITEGPCYLFLPDGSRVDFDAYRHFDEDVYGVISSRFTYNCTGIVDPHGRTTVLDGAANDGPMTITDPGSGRSLQVVYREITDELEGAVGDVVVKHVQEYLSPTQPGRKVDYSYTAFVVGIGRYTSLTGVSYFGDGTLAAIYTYQLNNPNANDRPLIATCNDSMFAGPMSQVAYDFVSDGVLLHEKHPNGTFVSTLAISGTDRTETRGDGPGGVGPSRTFSYTGGFLTAQRDFRPGNPPATREYLAGFVDHSIDERGYQTNYTHNATTGKITSITHPTTPSDDPPNSRGTVEMGYGPPVNPIYLTSIRDEREKTTTYTRHPTTHEVTLIAYPDNAQESFQYNSLGQIEWHRRKNEFYEHVHYNSRNLPDIVWNPVLGSTPPTGNEAKTVTSYYPLGHVWQDRVQTVTDPRGNSTTYEYDRLGDGTAYGGRGLVTRVIYPGGKFRTFLYDPYGRKTWEDNELRQPVDYVHDDYGRVTQVKVPRPDPDNPGMQLPDQWDTVIYDYTPPAGGVLSLTAGAATKVTSAAGLVVDNVYDPNLKVFKSTRQNPTGVAAITEFHYDANGNQDWVIDPRTFITTFDYDQRNRKTKSTSPPVDLEVGGVISKVPLVTEWFYDPAGNVRLIIQPDDAPGNPRRQSFTHDELNRVLTSKDPMDRVTTNTYTRAGMLKDVLDPKGQWTSFDYDGRDLKKEMTYPDRTTVVSGWVYDANGNMTQRPTADSTMKQLFGYDNRNRLKTMRWNTGIDFSDFQYDDASRLSYAHNPYSTVTRQYDVAGRLIHDKQLLVQTLNAPPSNVAQPIALASQVLHGGAGSFDIPLALDGTSGTECRTGGSYTMVITFSHPVTASGVRVASGIGTASAPVIDGNTVNVNLTGVSSAQTLTLSLTISSGVDIGQVNVPLRVLVGDSTGDGVVNAGDKLQTRSRLGQTTNGVNFRSDVNRDGSIDALDVTMVGANSGSSAPGPAPAQMNVSYEHDDDGRVKRLYVPSGKYDFSSRYDGMGRLEKIFPTDLESNPAEYHQYSYDASSNVTERRNFRNGTAQVFASDEINRLLERRIDAVAYNADPLGLLYHFSREQYGYDRMSRLVATDRTLRSPDLTEDVKRDSFGYNPAGELAQASYDNALRTVSYNLDNAGNRSDGGGLPGVNDNGNPLFYTPNPLNQYTIAQSTSVMNGSEHEISNHNEVSYRYLGDTYLASASSAAAGTYELGYDALGRTVRRTTNGQPLYYAYDGARSIVEYTAGGTINGNVRYGLGIDEIIARDNNGAVQWPFQDRLGNTSALSDANGEIVEQYSYDAFGTPEFRSGPGLSTPRGTYQSTTMQNNRILFTGREWVHNFGFYEYRARAYNPTLGRFMSEDPLGFAAGDTNLFRYCGGDPVNNVDPTGEYYRLIGGGKNWTVNIPIYYIGGTSAQRATFNSGIQGLTNNYGGNHVTFTVTNSSLLAADFGYGNKVTVMQGYNKNGFGWEGRNSATWWAGGGRAPDGRPATPEFGAAHSVWHFLGFKDLYNLSTGELNPGVSASNIMGGRPGSTPTDQMVDLVIKSGGQYVSVPGSLGLSFSGGRTWFGHNANGGGLYNSGAGWLPIGSASADLRWNPSAPTGNYISSLTSAAYAHTGVGLGATGEGKYPVSLELQ